MDTKRSQPSAYWALVEPIWDSVDIYGEPDAFLRQYAAVRPVQAAHLFAAHWCQSEVYNGGFEQFFCNPTGVLAPEALEAFRLIGLSEWAESLEEAMRFFGDPYPRDDAVRQQILARAIRAKRKPRETFALQDARCYEWNKREPNGFTRLADIYAQTGVARGEDGTRRGSHSIPGTTTAETLKSRPS